MSGLVEISRIDQLASRHFADLLVSQHDWYVCLVEPKELAQRLFDRCKSL
jgi:hypothetical protein